MSERDIIRTLQEEIEIPEIVQQKADAVFAAIQKETPENRNLPARKIPRKKSRKKVWIAIAAAVLALGTVSVGAAAYMKWSRSMEQGLHVMEEQKPALEENHTAVAVNKSATDNGITVTAQQTIVDNYYAYLSFKVEGYEVEEGVQPDFEFSTITVDGEQPTWDGSFYNGWIVGDDGRAVMDDGSPIPEAEDGSYIENYTMEDGSLDFRCILAGHDLEGSLIGKEIHVEFQNMGTVYKAEYTPDIQGNWTLDWVLEGCEDIRKCDLNVPLGDTDAKVIQAEISPISLKAVLEVPRQTIGGTAVNETEGEGFTHAAYAAAPELAGVRMKDGTLYPYLYSGPGFMGYVDEESDLYQISFAIDRILDIDQVDSLLFRKSFPAEGEPSTEANFYVVPLES